MCKNCNFILQNDLSHIHSKCNGNIFILHFSFLVIIFANKASLLTCVYGWILLWKGRAVYDGQNTKIACVSATFGPPICWKFSERTWELLTKHSRQALVPNLARGKFCPTVLSYDQCRPSKPTITRIQRMGRRRISCNIRNCMRAVLSSGWKILSCFACRPPSTANGVPRKSSSLPTRNSCCFRRRCRRCTSSSPNTIFQTEEIFQVKPLDVVVESLWFQFLCFFQCKIWSNICELFKQFLLILDSNAANLTT